MRIENAAGFGYDFRALSLESDALAQAFASLFSPSGDPGHPHPFTVLLNTIIGACLQSLPTLKLAKLIPNERIKAVYEAFDTIQTESAKIIKAKRQEVSDNGKDHEARKDLISILRAFQRAGLFLRQILTHEIPQSTTPTRKSSMTKSCVVN